MVCLPYEVLVNILEHVFKTILYVDMPDSETDRASESDLDIELFDIYIAGWMVFIAAFQIYPLCLTHCFTLICNGIPLHEGRSL
jgi:hypothetical protein